MTKKFILIQFTYLIILFIYYGILFSLNNSFCKNDFDVILFDYLSNGLILFTCFFITNLVVFMKAKNGLEGYPFIFYWSTFLFFLFVSLLVSFYNFISIGAPFKQNIFLNLLIPHTVTYIIIRALLPTSQQQLQKGK